MATHNLKFKASVDMSQANAEIQRAAKGFNIGLVRQASTMFAKQLEELAGSLGVKELAKAFSEVADASSNILRAYQAGGPKLTAFATALQLAIEAVNVWASNLSKAQEASDWINGRLSDRQRATDAADLKYLFATGADRRSMMSEVVAGQEDLLSKRDQLEGLFKALADANLEEAKGSSGFWQGLSDKFGSVLKAVGLESEEQFKASSPNALLDAVKKQILGIDAELASFKDVFDEFNRILDEEAKALAKAAEEEERARENIAEALFAETSSIFAQFDKSSKLEELMKDPNRQNIAQSHVKALEDAIAKMREAFEGGAEINNDALREAISDLATYKRIAETESAAAESEARMSPLDKTLEAMSGLASIGGSIAGESAQVSVDKNIEQTMKFVQQILDNTRQMNDTLNS